MGRGGREVNTIVRKRRGIKEGEEERAGFEDRLIASFHHLR